MTCILPPFSESVIPAKLDRQPDLYLNYNLVGLVESNPMLADRYSLCGAAEIVQISENTTIPCLVYLDDIIFSKTFEDYILHLSDVFTRLRSANVKLKPSRCSFARPSVEYLGHLVSCDGISPDPTKIAAVQKFPIPQCSQFSRSG